MFVAVATALLRGAVDLEKDEFVAVATAKSIGAVALDRAMLGLLLWCVTKMKHWFGLLL